MARENINYTEKINEIMKDMPEFIYDFIYNYGQTDKVSTKFQYCRDLRDYFRYMVDYMPEHCDKDIRELTMDDVASASSLDVNRYLSVLKGNGDKGLKDTTLKRRRATFFCRRN